MKFVCLFNVKESVTPAKLGETIARRAEYKFPEGIKLIAEYWSPSQPAVIAIVEAPDATALMMNTINWLDTFDVQVLPVSDYQEGLQKLSKHFGRK